MHTLKPYNLEKLSPVYNSTQLAEWDMFTIQNEPIKSIDLMERASIKFLSTFVKYFPDRTSQVIILAGKGNNGGDALAISRLLVYEDYQDIQIVLTEENMESCSPDFQTNYNRLPKTSNLKVSLIPNFNFEQLDSPKAILVDGLFGIGFKAPLKSKYADLVQRINSLNWKHVVAIDIPSGMDPDNYGIENTSIHATLTLTFQCLKRAFLSEENFTKCGKINILDIGLSNDFRALSREYFITSEWVKSRLKNQDEFAHKYKRGKTIIFAGSKEYPGAAVLSSLGAYASGAGLVEVICQHELVAQWLQRVPETVLSHTFSRPESDNKTKSLLIGPGIGREDDLAFNIKELIRLHASIPIVVDADALFLMKTHNIDFPSNCILTPHVGEFDLLFGTHHNMQARIETMSKVCKEKDITIVLKGKFTKVCLPDGTVFYNTTGNSALAKAGTGDLLAGMISGLLAQGYENHEACLIAVFIHGLAAEIAIQDHYGPSIQAGDLVPYISKAFMQSV
jgi:ADP-dependent NAD(P)H-hydrate dehydratase / NAD(P)H-hydrate epimerase